MTNVDSTSFLDFDFKESVHEFPSQAHIYLKLYSSSYIKTNFSNTVYPAVINSKKHSIKSKYIKQLGFELF